MSKPVALLMLAACGVESSEANLPTEVAALLADADARTAIQTYVAERPAEELSLHALREIPRADGRLLGDELHASIDDQIIVAPHFGPGTFEHAPWVASVDDASVTEIRFFDADGLASTLPRGEAPSVPYVVIRPRVLANTSSSVTEPEPPAGVTVSLYVREIDVRNDRETGSDAEIYIRCKQSGGWNRENLTSVNDEKLYTLWDEHVMSLSTTGDDVVCELWEEDDWDADDYMGSITIPVGRFESTTHARCFTKWAGNDAALYVSRSRGSNQCPQLEYLGMRCGEPCTDWFW